jgi:hypothetical protein
MAKQFSTKLIYHRCVYRFLFHSIEYQQYTRVLLIFCLNNVKCCFYFRNFLLHHLLQFRFHFIFYLIKSIGLVCILVNIYPLGLTCYFFVSISCDASTLGDHQFVCHKSSNLRSNGSDQVYNIQNKHSRYPPRSKNISHSFSYDIPFLFK